jgi:RNA polymerase sigma factor (sigma-70 family)
MEEQIYIQQVLAGEKDSFRPLVERYHRGLIIHCDQLLHDYEEAEDVAQEAFCQAYLKLADFNPEKARFSTWLYRIATNKALDRLRRSHRQLSVDEIELVAEKTMPREIEDEESHELRQAVLRLTPPEYRKVVEAYFWEGKSYAVIAEELQVPQATIGTWMHRAKIQLRKELS